MDFSEFASNALAIKRTVESPYSFTSALMRALPKSSDKGHHEGDGKKHNMSIGDFSMYHANMSKQTKKPSSDMFTDTRA